MDLYNLCSELVFTVSEEGTSGLQTAPMFGVSGSAYLYGCRIESLCVWKPIHLFKLQNLLI